MNVVEFFDPTNRTHCEAFMHLRDTGIWPKNFLPVDIRFPEVWESRIEGRIVDQYLKEKLTGKLKKASWLLYRSILGY